MPNIFITAVLGTCNEIRDVSERYSNHVDISVKAMKIKLNI
jgi:methylaspartate ammonia-lyase